MRYAACIIRLVCRNVHKRFFVSIFAFLLLTIKAIKCNFKLVDWWTNLRFLYDNFVSLKVGNIMPLVIVAVTILAEYPSK